VDGISKSLVLQRCTTLYEIGVKRFPVLENAGSDLHQILILGEVKKLEATCSAYSFPKKGLKNVANFH